MKKRLVIIKVILWFILTMFAISCATSLLIISSTVAPLPPDVESVDTVPPFFNQSPEDGLDSALAYYGIEHKDIVYAQAVLETGHFKSALCVNGNNLFGLYDSKNKRYYTFDHWTESVIAYRDWVQYKYKPPNDYYSFLKRIKYAKSPNYISTLQELVKKRHQDDTRRHTEGDTFPQLL